MAGRGAGPDHRPLSARRFRRADSAIRPGSRTSSRSRRMNPEQIRLDEDARREKNWKRWGPYLSERQWGTVREDYSATGECWNYFPHDHARSRAYRWGEDGLLGICDRQGRMCFALALWNGQDPHSEGTPLRPHRRGRQSRRGREGMLFLPGFHADALLHEGAVQVSAARVSLSAAGGREPAAVAATIASSN